MKLSSSIVIFSFALLAGSSHAEKLPLQSQQKTPSTHLINLNQASAEDLIHIVKGIGEKRALSIVQYRQKHGNFKSLSELSAVPGFGQRFVQNHWVQIQTKFVC